MAALSDFRFYFAWHRHWHWHWHWQQPNLSSHLSIYTHISIHLRFILYVRMYVYTSHVKGQNSQWQTASLVGGLLRNAQLFSWHISTYAWASVYAHISVYEYDYICVFRGTLDSSNRKLQRVHSSRRTLGRTLLMSSWLRSSVANFTSLDVEFRFSVSNPRARQGHV